MMAWPKDLAKPQWMRDLDAEYRKGDAERAAAQAEAARLDREEREAAERRYEEWRNSDAYRQAEEAVREALRQAGRPVVGTDGLTQSQRDFINKWIADQNGTEKQEEVWREKLVRKFRKENGK